MPQSATQPKTLRKALPYWKTTPRISVQTRNQFSNRHYDIIVVGAGISGALVAQALVDGKRRIALVDRREPVHGSSMASTAMIQHELDVPLFKLKQLLEPRAAERIWLRSAEAVKELVLLSQKRKISCRMQRKKALYLAGNEYGVRALKTEVEARNEIGLDASFLNSSDLYKKFQIKRTGAIVSDISASANPAQLTAGLLRDCVKQGVEIVRGTDISDFESLNDNVVLATSSGAIVSASHVVFCSGYEFLKSLEHKHHEIISTWAISSHSKAAQPDWLRDYLVWEASNPYLYFRTTNDDRIIAGGEDEKSDTAFLDQEKLERKGQKITKKLAELVGEDIGLPEFRWAAAFGTTHLGTPMIGPVSGKNNVYAAMGYGGNGITFSKIAADIISAQINGKSDPDETLFPFL